MIRKSRLLKLVEEKESADLRIGLEIRIIRMNLGLTMKEFAEKIGVTDGFISQVEHGNSGISKKHVMKIIELEDNQ